MNKFKSFLAAALVLLLAFVAPVANAQIVYPPATPAFQEIIHNGPLINWKAARGNAITNTARTKFVFIGDSTTAGNNGTANSNSFPARFATTMNTLGVPTRWDSITANEATSTLTDSRLVLGSGWGINSFSGASQTLENTTTLSAINFTPTDAIKAVDIYYFDYQAGVFTADCGGTGTQTVTNTLSVTWKKVTVTCTSTAVQAVHITRVSGRVDISIIDAYDTAVNANYVINMGVQFSTIAAWIQTGGGQYPPPLLTLLGAKVAFGNLGINDFYTTSTSLATSVANLHTLNTNMAAIGDFAFEFPNPILNAYFPETSQQVWEAAYAQQEVADSIPFMDLHQRWVNWVTMNGAGLTNGDNLHPSAIGYADEGDWIARTLAAY